MEKVKEDRNIDTGHGRRGRWPVVLLVLALLVGCAGKAVLPGVNIILVTVDTLRADHVGCYGCEEAVTPNIDRLAREGTTFLDGYSSVPLTLPSHTSFLTGTTPPYHGVHDNGAYTLGEDKTTIAEYLNDIGYETVAIVSSFQLNAKYGLSQGFEKYYDDIPKEFDLYDPRLIDGPKMQELRYESEQRRAENVYEKMKTWIDVRTDDRPFFLWMHFFDPHGVYDPPPPFDDFYPHLSYPDSLYDAEIAYLDHYIGKIFRVLKDRGVYDNTVIVLVADHGEGLGQHKELYHDQFVYDSTLRVPYIIGGGAAPKGWPELVLDPVRSVDVLPTLLRLAGARARDDVQGESLLPVLRGKRWDKPHYVESHSPTHNLCVKLHGIRYEGWKYIEAPTPELYHVEDDPGETVNLAPRNPEKAEELREMMLGYMKDDEALPEEVDFETRRKLEAIGYVQRTARRVAMARENRADPKDMADCIDGLHESMLYFTLGEYDSSLAVSLRLQEIFPGQTRIYDNIGNLQIRMEQYDEAIEEFTDVLRANPRYAKGYFWLGMARMRKHEDDRAIENFRKCIGLDDNMQVAHYNLGVTLARNGVLDEAIPSLEKTIRIDSRSNLAHLAQQALGDIRSALRAAEDKAAGG